MSLETGHHFRVEPVVAPSLAAAPWSVRLAGLWSLELEATRAALPLAQGRAGAGAKNQPRFGAGSPAPAASREACHQARARPQPSTTAGRREGVSAIRPHLDLYRDLEQAAFRRMSCSAQVSRKKPSRFVCSRGVVYMATSALEAAAPRWPGRWNCFSNGGEGRHALITPADSLG